MPRHHNADPKPGAEIVARRHIDWLENRGRWQWMLDSYEGGNRYRNAVYGRDRMGLPVRNLVRHKREYPDPRDYLGVIGGLGSAGVGQGADIMSGLFPGLTGADPNATASDDDYEMRRARTPPPEYVAECVEIHLSKVYDQEVKRTGPDALAYPVGGWWADVDGCGTDADDWMSETIAPLLMVYGFLDVLFDHPPVPDGEKVETLADQNRLDISRCVATYILPENMLWYKLDRSRAYAECLVLEYIDPADWEAMDDKDEGRNEWAQKHLRLRHWKGPETTLYDVEGVIIEPTRTHAYGRPPIIRVFDRRKHRSPHVGKSRYEGIAEIQREIYNRASELILSDTLQAHPLLQGPEDYVESDGTVPIGPNWMLPKKKNTQGPSATYEGFEAVSFPKDGAESIRRNMMDLIDAKDRGAHLTKPAGAAGSTKGTIAQSGIAKNLDNETGNKVLSKISNVLAKAERAFAEYALMVCLDREPTDAERAAIDIIYPSRFDLFDLDELTKGITDLQSIMAACGDLPEAETLLIQVLERKLLRNLSDGTYEALDAEVVAMVAAMTTAKKRAAADASLGTTGEGNALDDQSTEDSAAESDPTGQTNVTALGGSPPTRY